MTSSLVGSEMCIRDRAVVADWEAARRKVWAFCPDGAREEHLGGRLSVSYTHLTLPTICSV
eukprot:9887378-Prorocentrum_lima.AAC.1